jgi:hypothetical protein
MDINTNNTSGNNNNNIDSLFDRMFNIFSDTFINEINRIPFRQNPIQHDNLQEHLINDMVNLRRTIESRFNLTQQSQQQQRQQSQQRQQFQHQYPFLTFTQNNFLSNFESMIDQYTSLFNEINEEYENMEDVKVTVPENVFETFETIVLTNDNFDNYKEKSCNICIEEFKLNDTLTNLKCNHFFHKNCIKTWLTKQSKKCPICRNETF